MTEILQVARLNGVVAETTAKRLELEKELLNTKDALAQLKQVGVRKKSKLILLIRTFTN